MTFVASESYALGCEPQLTVIVTQNLNGKLTFEIVQTDDGADPVDIDGLFLNLSDTSTIETLEILPNAGMVPISDYQEGDGDVQTLSNGASLADGYDVGIQFGTTAGETTGEITNLSFTVYSDEGPLTLADFDFDSMAAAVDTDDPEGGLALLVNEGDVSDPDGDDPEVDTCTFLIEGDVNVEVILSELETGEIQMDLSVLGADDPDGTGQIGDLGGLFFDIGDDTLLDDLEVSGDDVTAFRFSADDVSDLGRGVNMNGSGGGDFDGGIRFGTPGKAADDIQSTSVTLSHPDGLSLEDFADQLFGVRLTSVGEEDGDREGSLKLLGLCEDTDPEPPVCEDEYPLASITDLFTPPEAEDPYFEAEDPEFETLDVG